MTTYTHYLRQTFGDIDAPFSCFRCGETEVIETDFYTLNEAFTGRPWDRSN